MNVRVDMDPVVVPLVVVVSLSVGSAMETMIAAIIQTKTAKFVVIIVLIFCLF